MASTTVVTATSRSHRALPAAAGEQTEETRAFLATAFERFRLAEEAEAEIRRDALDDFRFLVGRQWDDDNFNQRTRDGRPCLTMNRLRQFRRMVTNEQRQSRPAIQINPVGDGADIETAEILQGVIRHIEVNSDAEIAYDTGFEHMVTGGFGYWRVVTEYIDDESFDQEIVIKRIRNPFTVYFDPRACEPDYSDALFAFVIDDMPLETYKAEYPDSAMADLAQFVSIGDEAPGWATRDTVRVAEYFHIETEKTTLRKRGQQRDVFKHKVMWAKINAIEVLDEREVPGCYIPIVPILGDDQIVDGKRRLVGMIRDAKDPQRFYNYQISAAAEAIALAPKAPHIVAEGQIEGHEVAWEQSNRRNMAVLTYKPVSSAGQPIGPPQRNAVEPPIQAMAAMIRQADNDLKATTGIWDASLGSPGPDQSGRAILARQRQSDVANLNYVDNQTRSIRHTGRILLGQIPIVYDAPRVQRIIKPDDTVQQIGIYNSQNSDRPDDFPEDIKKIYDIGVGRYDVSISVGPSYQSKRQEAVASQMALVSSYPQIMPIAGDLLVRNMDWPGAPEIADRLKRMLPPQLQDQGGPTDDPAAAAQQAAAQAQMMQAQNQQLMAQNQQLLEIVRTKQIEATSKLELALIDQQTKLNVSRIVASRDRDIAGADREMDMLQKMHDSAHDAASQAADQTHDRTMAQMPEPTAPPQPPPGIAAAGPGQLPPPPGASPGQ